MSNWGAGYQHEASSRLEPGDYRVCVMSVEETTSRSSGNPMLVIEIKPSGTKLYIKHYIVKNEYFNRNMTQFFESFDIEEGDFNFVTWPGAHGAACLKEDERGYMKVAYFIRNGSKREESLPPWEGPIPERQVVDEQGFTEVEDDELPF